MRRLFIMCLSTVMAAGLCSDLRAAEDRPGYLDTIPDITRVVPPPPHEADPRYEADRRVFQATRSMLRTPRGALATHDVPYTMPDLMHDFSFAAGIPLSPASAPATYRLLSRADTDTQRANEAAKQNWKRLRPFQIDRGPICQSKAELAKSYDYPSGHAAHGWTIGLILSDLIPTRAPQLLARARAYGESRIVCGAHNMSAVEASQLGVTVSLQQVRLNPRYLTDFAAAKTELEGLSKSSALPCSDDACQAEMALIGTSVLADLSSGSPKKGK
jgi:acid phosphatase (class A)